MKQNSRIDRTPRELLSLKINPSILIDYCEDVMKQNSDNSSMNWLVSATKDVELAISKIKAYNKEIELIRGESKELSLPPSGSRYEKDIYKFLNQLQPGETIIIKNYVNEKNIKKFIDIVKKYMLYHSDMNTIPFCAGIEFTNDYSQIKKLDN